MNATARKTPSPHGFVLDFGRHRGMLITRVPVSYLKFMVRNQTPHADVAAAELERRGTVTPNLEVSAHAIDRASLRLWDLYCRSRKENEGLHAWLVRFGEAALKQPYDGGGRHLYMGMEWVFDKHGVWPVLLTVHPAKRRHEPSAEAG